MATEQLLKSIIADTAYLTLAGDGLSAKGRAWLLGTESKV